LFDLKTRGYDLVLKIKMIIMQETGRQAMPAQRKVENHQHATPCKPTTNENLSIAIHDVKAESTRFWCGINIVSAKNSRFVAGRAMPTA
jgi:hypothetical protein